MLRKSPQTDVEVRIQEKVLRIAERRDHAAKVGRERLKREHHGGKANDFQLDEHDRGKRQHDDERDVVREGHGEKRGNEKDHEGERSGVADASGRGSGDAVEGTFAAKRACDCQHAEQAPYGFPIEVAEVQLVGRNEEHGYERRDERSCKHPLLFDYLEQSFPYRILGQHADERIA